MAVDWNSIRARANLPLAAASAHRRTLGLVAFATSAGVIAGLIDVRGSAMSWLAAALVVIAPPLIRLAQRRTAPLDLFEPIVFASVVYFLNFLLQAALAEFYGYSYPAFPSVDVSNGTWAIVGGAGAFAIGYFFVTPSPLRWEPERRVPRRTEYDRRVVWAIAATYSLVSIGTYILYWFPDAGGAAAYLDPSGAYVRRVETFRGTGTALAAGLVAAVGFFVASANTFLRRHPTWIDWSLVGATGLISAVATALSKNRSLLLWDLAIPLIILHYGRSPLKVGRALAAGLVMFAAVVASTLLIRDPFAFAQPNEVPVSGLARFLVQQAGEIFVVSDVVERQPYTLDYQGGGTLIASAVNIVPRALWPEKPETAGEIYTRRFFPDVWLSGLTYLGVPWLAELYLNGGIVVLLSGSLVTGTLAAYAHRRLVLSRSPVAVQMQALLAFTTFMLIIRGSQPAFTTSLVWGIPLLFANVLLQHASKGRITHMSRRTVAES